MPVRLDRRPDRNHPVAGTGDKPVSAGERDGITAGISPESWDQRPKTRGTVRSRKFLLGSGDAYPETQQSQPSQTRTEGSIQPSHAEFSLAYHARLEEPPSDRRRF